MNRVQQDVARQPRASDPLREFGLGPFLIMLYVAGLVGLFFVLVGSGKRAVLSC
jgi:hypothetical protein